MEKTCHPRLGGVVVPKGKRRGSSEYQASILFKIGVFYDLGASCNEVTEVFSF